MRTAPIALNENDRLHAVAEYDLAAGSTSADLDQIALLASSVFQVPIALISFVERDRQIFLAKVGIDVCETALDVSFCSHAIRRSDILVVLDATLDARFSDNPLVTGAPHIRFYAGIPLIGPSGQALGTLCVVDNKPHASFSEEDRILLRELAAVVLDRLEFRRLEIARSAGQVRFRAAAGTSPDGVVCFNANGQISFWNAACERMFARSSVGDIGRHLTKELCVQHVRGTGRAGYRHRHGSPGRQDGRNQRGTCGRNGVSG
jgi:GAF domain-containing protein